MHTGENIQNLNAALLSRKFTVHRLGFYDPPSPDLQSPMMPL